MLKLARSERRWATVVVPNESLVNHPDEVMEVLGRGLILQADFNHCAKSVYYQMVHPDVDPLPEGEMGPTLHLRIETWIGGRPVFRLAE